MKDSAEWPEDELEATNVRWVIQHDDGVHDHRTDVILRVESLPALWQHTDFIPEHWSSSGRARCRNAMMELWCPALKSSPNSEGASGSTCLQKKSRPGTDFCQNLVSGLGVSNVNSTGCSQIVRSSGANRADHCLGKGGNILFEQSNEMVGWL
ncbi:hypothetical protein BDN72DRAFT_839517 [Pluteus cervinus]|uniref:Uncharacterized protein n=1 Tax=Pluteus cervinus TaxID=181527 RepID=A0ACD3AVP9_9AGAR|nr:hypothetical protein BDN72DRAFT_839517 [Pluteus cervinus]